MFIQENVNVMFVTYYRMRKNDNKQKEEYIRQQEQGNRSILILNC